VFKNKLYKKSITFENMQKQLILLVCSLFLLLNIASAQPANKTVKLPKPITALDKWVDSVYNTLSLDQKLGQLFMVAAYSGGEKYNRASIEKLIANNGIGGLIFMQGTPEAQAEQTNAFQRSSKIPLLIGMDAEWGLGMRLKNVDDFPRQIMMGAMHDTNLVYQLGKAIAYQCKRLGVHMDFAPVVDINNNPNNPVINFRSFGENKYAVARYSAQYVKGLQENGVIASAKHFPGHGNTDVDSHKDLPTITSSLSSLENLELYPFKEMINAQVGSIMIAHLQVPALESAPNVPTTLSKKVVTTLLKEKLGYKGLIITDALNMNGVAKYYKPGEVDAKAFSAGNDILLFSQDVATGISKIKQAIDNGEIDEYRVEESVKKILKAKFLVGLNKPSTVSSVNITTDLNKYTSNLRSAIAAEAITLLKDNNQVLSKIKSGKRIAYVGVGIANAGTFGAALQKAGITEQYFVNGGGSNLVAKLKEYDAVIVGVHGIALYPGKSFGLNSNDISVANSLMSSSNAIGVAFGNPYVMKYFCGANAALVTYDEKPETQQAAAAIILGKEKAKGKLPVSVCPNFAQGCGIVFANNLKKKDKIIDIASNTAADTDSRIIPLETTDTTHIHLQEHVPSVQKLNMPVDLTCCINPSTVGADNTKLDKIDALMENAIAKKAFPGCRVVAIKDGKIFYDKSFGNTRYYGGQRVNSNTVYDLASVTKVMATTLAIMKLYEQKKISLDATLGEYVPAAKYSDKSYLKLKDILLHQAGLKSWIPFYKETMDSNKMQRQDVYAYKKGGNYTIPVSKDLYMNKHWVDTMWQRIYNSPLGAKNYEYSDLDFIFLQKVVEKVSGTSLDNFVEKEFYKPLGLKNIGYTPLAKGTPISSIAPSEDDNYFRYQVVQGYVHDMAAAMFGGVSGHAGLFSTTNDVAVILQMLLNGGTYNGKRYFEKSTVDFFTNYHSSTRRGYGWDKTEPNKNKTNVTADNCSLQTFGHTGFTGTCVWADPAYNLQFIFLSNRTFPSAENKLITNMDIRTKAQQYMYESLGIEKAR
jgi:beta-N-acetylhexosaminidase